MRPSYLNNLLSPINLVSGIGPKIEKLFNRIDINLKVHFLWHLPYNIIKRQKHEYIDNTQINTLVTLKIKSFGNNHLSLFSIEFISMSSFPIYKIE